MKIDSTVIDAAERRYDAFMKHKTDDKLHRLYRKGARILAEQMTREEFLELQELIDSDPNDGMYEAITMIAAEADPTNFVQPGEDPMNKLHSKASMP